MFYSLNDNLYLVAIPKIENKDTVIEDFFEPVVLNTIVRGKTFTLQSSFDGNKYYSKHVFAEDVVKKNQKTINFNPFIKILGRIDSAIEHSSK